MTTLLKTESTCSNSYLIDENLCLAGSLGIINYNVSSLSSAIFNMESYERTWYNLYSLFTSYSAIWLKTATNIESFSAKWIDTSTTVSRLSSDWNKSFTIYYPTLIDISTWNSLSVYSKNSFVSSWLNIYFDPFVSNNKQIIDVVVYIKQAQPFSFNFNRSYNEPCTPTGGGISVSCSGCRKPYIQCNHHGGNAGYGPCTNALDQCSETNNNVASGVSCTGTGGKLLSIGLNRHATDNNIARTVVIRYQNINNIWTSV